jgi:hypothetical protein
MPGNSNLHDSSRNKQDEFYTNLQLVEDELKHYRAHFKGKRVLCNCDDPYERYRLIHSLNRGVPHCRVRLCFRDAIPSPWNHQQ